MTKSWTGNTISRALEDAYFEIDQLGEDMREVFEATPEQFKDNSGRWRGIAADILEAVFNPSVPASIAGDGHYIEWLEVRKGKDGKLFRPARRDNAVRCLKAGLAYASRVTDDSQDMAQFKQGIEKIFIIWRLSTFLAWQVASSGEAPRQRLESKRFMYHKAIATWPMRKTSPTKRLLNCSNYFQSRVSLVRKPTARTS